MTFEDTITLYDYVGSSTSITVPSSINGYFVSKLDNTFSYCYNLKDLVLPESLTEIGDSAFYRCERLNKIIIPEKVKRIGDSAFSYCDNLQFLCLPQGLSEIGASAFSNCDLKNIIIPQSVSKIDGSIFYNTNSVKIYCQAQSKPDGWDNDWLSGKTYDLTWGFSDFGITEDGFLWIEKDDDMRILDYSGSSSNLIIPAKVNGKYFTSIADEAFYDRLDIKSLDFDADSKLHTIGEKAFYYCNNLTNVTLPNSLATIKNYAFNRCRFSQIIIPLSVTEIQGYAFSSNSNLDYIYCEASQKPDNWASNWYSGYVSVRWGYTAQ